MIEGYARRRLWLLPIAGWLRRLSYRLADYTFPKWSLGSCGIEHYGRRFGAKRRERDDRLDVRRDPCAYCGAPSETIDHVIALSDGGANDETNKVGACRSCNGDKADRKLVWFLLGRANHTAGRIAVAHGRLTRRALRGGRLRATIRERVVNGR